VYKDFVQSTPSGEMENIRFIDAISIGLRQSMERHENDLSGQDIVLNMVELSRFGWFWWRNWERKEQVAIHEFPVQ
jgi:hypothetical protein